MLDPQVLVGATLGFAAALTIVVGLLSLLDGRYVSRREYAATLQDVQRQLTEIKRAADHGRLNLED